MSSSYDSFNNLETSMNKASVIQERMNLVSTHMYKQFLEYQHANVNMSEVFMKMLENMHVTVEYLKQSFSSRGVSAQNIFYEIDSAKTVATMKILWRSISFTIRGNDRPQALALNGETPIITGRVMAIDGNYFDIIKSNYENETQALLEHEIASLYIPSDKTQSSVIKIKHLKDQNFYINQMDASREFLLKVIEIICGGGILHEEGAKKSFLH